MNMLDVFARVIDALEASQVPYMVVGSVATMAYGEPRMTHDLDLVIDIPAQKASTLGEIFPLDAFYCPPVDVLVDEVVRRGQFNLIHHASGLKIDFVVRKDTKHGQREFARRQRFPLWEGRTAFLACPEDVILKKLEYFRDGGSEKHLRDIRGVLAQSEVNEAYLAEWVDELELGAVWARVNP